MKVTTPFVCFTPEVHLPWQIYHLSLSLSKVNFTPWLIMRHSLTRLIRWTRLVYCSLYYSASQWIDVFVTASRTRMSARLHNGLFTPRNSIEDLGMPDISRQLRDGVECFLSTDTGTCTCLTMDQSLISHDVAKTFSRSPSFDSIGLNESCNMECS